MSRRPLTGLLLALVLLIAGCATPPQPPIDLSPEHAGRAKGSRVGVAVSALPKPDTQFPGAGCLLCIAIASANHSALTAHVQKLGTSELDPLKSDLVKLLNARGMQAVAIEAPLDVAAMPDRRDAPAGQARKDFSALKARHGIDRLLVVDVQSLGVWRSYSGYIPQGAPRAVVNGSALLVELGSHALEWYVPLDIGRAAEGEWDEPPRFPGLTNAYYQALELALDKVRKPFQK